MNRALRIIIVDDEPPARERLRQLLNEADVPSEVVGEAGSGEDGLPMIYELRPDLLLLDIRMPVLDGFQVVDLLPKPRPIVVFVTAYEEYAVKAFEVHAIDYLTKPVKLARLNQTLQRTVDMLSDASSTPTQAAISRLLNSSPRPPLSRITIRIGRRLRVVSVDSISRFQSEGKSTLAVVEGKVHPVDFTLAELEARLDENQFLRTHRSYIVRINEIRELIPWFSGTWHLKMADGSKVPVARRRVNRVKAILGGQSSG